MEKFFIAKIIWQIKLSNTLESSEFDEQLRIIKAGSSEQALKKANELGLKQEESFLNKQGQQISWVFINVEFIKEIASFEDGMEICAQTVKITNAIEYINEINMKSMLNTDQFLLKIN